MEKDSLSLLVAADPTMTFDYKATAMLLLVSGITSIGSTADAAGTPEVSAFEIPSPRQLDFFSFFATDKNRHKFEGRLDCVYGDVVKGKMCPPKHMEDPMADLKIHESNSILDVFSRCLDDPDDPDCRELQAGEVSPWSYVAQPPAHLRNLFSATLSPTMDDCGGNMFDPRFCASSMPSLSMPPIVNDEDDPTPLKYRIVGTDAPTECLDRKASPFVKTSGSEVCPVLFSNDALPIVVESTTTDTVSVKIVNTFPAHNSLGFLALVYPDAMAGPTCLVLPKPDVAAVSDLVKAKCDASGFAQLEMVAVSPAFKGIQEAGTVPEACELFKNHDPACTYVMAVTCACQEETEAPTKDSSILEPQDDDETVAPTAAPSGTSTSAGTECEDRDAIVQFHLLSGKCTVEEDPIVMASRTNKFAILELFQTWAPKVDFISALFMQNGVTMCASDKDITKEMTDETPLTYTVDCGPGDWATVYLYVKDSSFDSTGVVDMPEICTEQDFVESSADICSYKVTVSCLCNPESPSTSPSFAPSFSPSVAPSFAPSAVPSAAPSAMPSTAPSSAPSAQLETRRLRFVASKKGTFRCSSEDFPCSDGPRHVNVCHYSSRIGYRTYCVPETDSEIVRFYADDYCGPCTGGYAVGETGEVF